MHFIEALPKKKVPGWTKGEEETSYIQVMSHGRLAIMKSRVPSWTDKDAPKDSGYTVYDTPDDLFNAFYFSEKAKEMIVQKYDYVCSQIKDKIPVKA